MWTLSFTHLILIIVSIVLFKLLVATKQTRSKNRDLGIALEKYSLIMVQPIANSPNNLALPKLLSRSYHDDHDDDDDYQNYNLGHFPPF